MTVNYVSIGREEASLNIANINLLFPSVTRVLGVLLTTAATSASVERLDSKEHVPKVSCTIPAASYVQSWTLYSNVPGSV